jgi:terminase, large subunit
MQTLCPMPDATKRRISGGIPAWMSPEVAADVLAFCAAKKREPLRFIFSKGERATLRRRAPIRVSDWAERHRVVEMSSIPGKWKNVFAPYLAGIMDAAGTAGVEVVILCKSPQTGGSEAGHNIVGWAIDRSAGPVMYVYPDELTARENARDRIIPMLTHSPRLRSYMTGLSDDASSLRINLAHMPIYLGWSGSVSRLGNKPIRTLILDELDKYKNPKNEATSEALAEKRTTTWRSRRHIFKISTPTTEDGAIWLAFTKEANIRFRYWVCCPHCGMMQLMLFDSIAWPHKDSSEEPSAEEVLSRKLAYYTCEHCGAVWDDGDRDRAVRKGEWRDEASGMELSACLRTLHPQKVGFHVPAWISYFVSLSEVASAALKHKAENTRETLMNLQNQYKAEPWALEYEERGEEGILRLCDDRPRGAVPSALPQAAGLPLPRVACLLAGVDTQGVSEQKGYFRYVIRAFGFGEEGESWLVQCGVAPTFAALTDILWRSVYRDAQGREYRVRAAMIDAMGLRASQVYAYCIKHRGRAYPWQGVRSLTQPFNPSPQEYFPDARGNKIKIPGGMNLWRCDVTFFKSDLAHRLGIAPDDPGAFHLHSNADGGLEQYAREMCAEVWDDEKHGWENPRRRPNHYWDCEVMTRALAYILNVRHIPRPAESADKPSPQPAPRPRQTMRNIGERMAGFRR